jgi:RNA polymerase sigma-70 factor (ECF subfamily)
MPPNVEPAAKPLASTAARADPLAPLVARMGAGDEAALSTLYDAAVRAIYSLAVRIVRDPHLAEEVTEDTFFSAWRDAARYTAERGRVMTWLMVMCRSRALDALRRLEPAVATDDVESLLAHEASSDDDADSLVEQFRTNSAVRAAVEALPPQERQAISLSFFRGLTHQEIADQWQIPLGSVKTIMNRAFGRLREACAPQWKELNEH